MCLFPHGEVRKRLHYNTLRIQISINLMYPHGQDVPVIIHVTIPGTRIPYPIPFIYVLLVEKYFIQVLLIIFFIAEI